MSTSEPISNDLINLALQIGGVGVWRVNLQQWSMVCSGTCKANFGIGPEEELPYRQLESLIDSSDRGRWGQAVADAIHDHTDFDFEYRITTPQGERRWIHARGRVTYGEKGEAIEISGITQNITARKTAELATQKDPRQAESILANFADGLIVLDREWRFTYLNERGHEILSPLEADRPPLLGQSIWDLPDIKGTLLEEQYRRAVEKNVPVSFEVFYLPLDTWFLVRACPTPMGLTIYFLDINFQKLAVAN